MVIGRLLSKRSGLLKAGRAEKDLSANRFHGRLVLAVASVLLAGTSDQLLANQEDAANLAYEQPAPTVHPELTAHSKTFRPQMAQISESVYMAVAFGTANSFLIEGDDGVIIVDAMESVASGQKVYEAFREITDKPIKAVIVTHAHSDHFGGIAAFISQEQVDAGEVKVITHEKFMEGVLTEPGILGNLVTQRTKYWAGVYLPKGPEGLVNIGCCAALPAGPRSFIAPTDTFDDKLVIDIAGVELHLVHAPSETRDELVVWFPKEKVIFTADVLMGEAYPNLTTLRGSLFRDPNIWIAALDMMRAFPAEHMAPSHGRPEHGKERVHQVLTNYRDGIQFVVDQSMRYMIKGYTPDEMVEMVKLPRHLAEAQWLQEFYGTLHASVKGMYYGYIGYFDGDPWSLGAQDPITRAHQYVDLMGGRNNVLQAARRAFEEEKYNWTQEILTYLIRVNPYDMEARNLKADAVTEWAYLQKNPPWRNWGLTAAMELRGELPDQESEYFFFSSSTKGKKQEEQVLGQNTAAIFADMRIRLIAEKAGEVNTTIGVEIRETGEQYGLQLRHGILEVNTGSPDSADFRIALGQADLVRLASRVGDTAAIIKDADIRITDGKRKDLAKFLSYFEARPSQAVPMVLPAMVP